nr:PIG-L family deacetylase [Pararhodobacter sp. SW119]
MLVPHPDDESLGCGLAIAALADAGLRVRVVLVTDGSRSHPRSTRFPPPRLARLRALELRRALRHLIEGIGPAPMQLGYPDLSAPSDPQTRRAACARIAPLIGPQTGAIWASWAGDPHIDHACVARLAASLHADHPHLARWSYPIWGRFKPSLGIPSSSEMVLIRAPALRARKRKALAAHASQMTRLISDDPDGFVMDPEHQRHFLDHPEIFIREHPA